jgi:hypothetical protein
MPSLSALPSRHEVLRIGLAGFSTLSLADLLRSRAEAATPTEAGRTARTALILVWLHGGASHLETYDPKPLASSDYRGPYAPIATNVPGLDLCELLSHHAKVADRFSLLRSVVHTGFCHQQGTQQLLTGHPERVLRSTPLHPDVFSVAHKLRYQHDRRLPHYVSVSRVSYGGSAYLGAGYSPFVIHEDPNNSAGFRPWNERACRIDKRVADLNG